MSLEFFVATDEEVAGLSDIENLFEMIWRYEIIASGAKDFQDFKLLSHFFLQNNEDYVPRKTIRTISGNFEDNDLTFQIYKLERKFVENVAQIEEAKLDNPDSIEYW